MTEFQYQTIQNYNNTSKMSYAQPSVIPLSFSVERLLQHTKRSGGSTPSGGSVGCSSDNDSTPPSSPESSCNFTDLQADRLSTSSVHFNGQFLVNAAPNFATTTLSCIPLSALTWNPAGAAISPAQPHPWRVGIPTRPGTNAAFVPCSTVFPAKFSGRTLDAATTISKSRPKNLALHPPQLISPNNSKRSCNISSVVFSPNDQDRQTRSPIMIKDPKHHTTPNEETSMSPFSTCGNKKKRTTFSSSQLESLEVRFSQQKYLTKHDRSKLAATLGLTEKHIKTWYQNRRTKWKRECTDEVWSKERENAATAMYAQHLHLKSTTNIDDTSLMHQDE